MERIVKEGKARIEIVEGKKISKKLPVFYNPVMQNNRDVSVLLLKAVRNKDMQIGLPLAASGVRGIRFLKELGRGKIKNISFNDNSKKAAGAIKNNLRRNKIKLSKKVSTSDQDASLFLLKSTGFDYIDIDPFGSPNPFLDSAVRRIARGGVLAVTATDTSNLAGTFKDACMRKYWALPLDNELRHEIGLRILIRKVQLVGGQYEKALVPLFSYFKDHYYRIFFGCTKGKKKVDEVIKKHGGYEGIGPIWLGRLWDKRLALRMWKNCRDKELKSFLGRIKNESKIERVGFFDVHAICKRKKLKVRHKIDDLVKKIRKKGFKAERTHFSGNGVRTEMPLKQFIRILG